MVEPLPNLPPSLQPDAPGNEDSGEAVAMIGPRRGNLFQSTDFKLPDLPLDQEEFLILLETPTLRLERIISVGHTTASGEWYDQPQPEWVMLLQGEAVLSYDDGTRLRLRAGDYVLIPAHCRHRVDYTSADPACVWLALHFTDG